MYHRRKYTLPQRKRKVGAENAKKKQLIMNNESSQEYAQAHFQDLRCASIISN
jgi:hypothetical protein